MPDIPFLRALGFDGGMVEDNNKVRVFGPNGQKQAIGELQMYRIAQNNRQLAAQFILQHSGKAQNPEAITLHDIQKVQDVLFEKLNALSEIQQLVTGNPINASVDIPQILAGNEAQYIQSLLNKAENLQHIQDTLDEKQRSRLGQILGSFGIALTLPSAYARFENRDIKLPDIEKGRNQPVAFILGDGAFNFTAKLGSLIMPQGVLQLNFNDRENKILRQSYNLVERLKQLPQ